SQKPISLNFPSPDPSSLRPHNGGLFAKSFNPDTDLPILDGKVILVTGENAGIGYATVKHLVRRGAKVYLGARSESKATGAIASLEAEGLGDAGGRVLWARVDLGDPREAKKCAEEFLGREQKLDVLSISEIMVTNHFSPFVFTQTLLPLLKRTAEIPGADVRIVNLASRASNVVSKTVRFRTVEDYNLSYEDSWFWPEFRRYAFAKFCNILWTRALQAHLEGTSIIAIAVHPGGVNTFAHRLPFLRFFKAVLPYLGLVSPDEGAYTSVIAAASPDVRAQPDVYKGAFLMPIGRVNAPPVAARSDVLAAELWTSTESVLKDIGL
ncbi:hypothetical protein PLICRDRAFT_37935, partial [Plicaturopsis crispa FD-325 SS-3]